MEELAVLMGDLPDAVCRKLDNLRQMDGLSSRLITEIQNEEAQLLQTLNALNKAGKPFDEEPLKLRYDILVQKRQLLSATLEGQMQKIKTTYDDLDKKITLFDTITKPIVHLFPTAGTEQGDASRRKKRKKQEQEAGALQESFVDFTSTDPNEPVYCTCRRISFGQMVACENVDCPIEWYHFGCVGLKEEPPDPWFCKQCLQKDAAKKKAATANSSSSSASLCAPINNATSNTPFVSASPLREMEAVMTAEPALPPAPTLLSLPVPPLPTYSSSLPAFQEFAAAISSKNEGNNDDR